MPLATAQNDTPDGSRHIDSLPPPRQRVCANCRHPWSFHRNDGLRCSAIGCHESCAEWAPEARSPLGPLVAQAVVAYQIAMRPKRSRRGKKPASTRRASVRNDPRPLSPHSSSGYGLGSYASLGLCSYFRVCRRYADYDILDGGGRRRAICAQHFARSLSAVARS